MGIEPVEEMERQEAGNEEREENTGGSAEDSGLSQGVVPENAEEEGEEGRIAPGATIPYNPI